MKNEFKNANEAFKYFNKRIRKSGKSFSNTKALFNVGFYIKNPLDNKITHKKRKWSEDYADAEMIWYLSGNKSIKALGDIYGKIPAIWKKMADENGEVNSNYGWQWHRNGQLEKVVEMLIRDTDTRRASISIYDGKEIDSYEKDTPCTYAVHFDVVDDKLNMSVFMRSNDLWYGFCNDQYCFSMLQSLVSYITGIEVGTYYHFAHNLHLYEDKL